jgi:type IV pilus assembly protein PilV
MKKPQVPRSGFRPHAALGASLIEVLVSIVIASIGLLALAGVNAASIRYTKMSQYRATATQLANDIGERLRANKGVPAVAGSAGPPVVVAVAATAFFAGNYDYAASFRKQATAPVVPTTASVPGPCHVPNDAGDFCSAADIAAIDLWQWRLLVRSQLPEGSVVLKSASNVGANAMDVWVVWRNPSALKPDPTALVDDAPALAHECPDSLKRGDDPDPTSIRCSYFRINL